MRPWIKFNITLFTDPRVDAIASAIAAHAARYIMDAQHAKDLFGVTESVTCHALRDVTVTALLRIFIAGHSLKEVTEQHVIIGCTTIPWSEIDRIAKDLIKAHLRKK